MSFPLSLLSPWSALVAAAVIPPLVLLYFLKLKRREMSVSSTLLWRRAVQDLQVNSPFQRLRRNLLLLLQLLILILAVLAITEPIWKRATTRDRLMILLVDHSASMNTVEPDGRTRLDSAKLAARRIVDGMGKNDRIMVIAFAGTARSCVSFTDDKAQLKAGIDAIEPTDELTRLREALVLAEAHSTPLGEGIGTPLGNPISVAHLILISDGRIADAPELTLRRGTMEMISVGAADNNVGIVNMDIRRNYERAEMVNVVVRLRNFGPAEATRDVSLFIDNELKEVRSRVGLSANVAGPGGGGATAPASQLPSEGSEAVVSFEVRHESAGQIEVRLGDGTDAFAADDRAYGTIDAPRPVSTLLVTPGNYFLKLALSALPGQPPTILTPEQYEKAADADLLLDGRMKYDVVVFDEHSTERLPPGSYVFFGGVPKLPDVRVTGEVTNDLIVDWDNTHPILRHIVVELIHVLRWNRLEMPREAQTLIAGADGPVLSLLGRDRRQYLVCAFGIFNPERSHLNTNWVMAEGFPAFMYNALQFMAGNVAAGGNRSVPPGAAVAIRARPGAKTLTLRRPDLSRETVPVRDDGVAYYANTGRTGFYVPADAAGPDATFAVNLCDDAESDIRPNDQFEIGSQKIASSSGSQRVNRPVWSWFILAALIVSFIEWVIYNKRVFV